MKRVLASSLPKPGRSVDLPESEADHAVRVLRLRDGDLIEALDGQGHAATVKLRIRGGMPVRLEYTEETRKESPSAAPAGTPVPVTLEMAILKGDAMEWAIEKAVELGVTTLVPTMTAHTVIQIKSKGPEAFQARWQKIADQALKQCGRLERMVIALPQPLPEVLTQATCDLPETPRLWFDEAARGHADTPYLMDWLRQAGPEIKGIHLLVGPEGGWSDPERELMERASGAATFRVGLGPWVLRAETASLFAVSLVTATFRAPFRVLS